MAELNSVTRAKLDGGIIAITLHLGITYNVGNYESVKVTAGAELESDAFESADDAFDMLREYLIEQLGKSTDDIVDYHNHKSVT